MPLKPGRILWPTDFSELSLEGARYARGFRESFGCELHVLHVVAPPIGPDVSLMLPAEFPLPVTDPEMITACRRSLAKLAADQFGGDPSITCDVQLGASWSGICDYAKGHQIDLIIVATHGRTGLPHVLIGSTAERIVQHAPCPVLVVKHGQCGFAV
ncbi:Universal stress protein E [Phycisphaerae bacterium RAS1]|nr:Universal stress protein E [Phycisphaerae bacterium RAS1]